MDKPKLRFLSLFSGIDAASVAWLPLGFECVGFSEIEKFPSQVLSHHYPDVPNLGDVTKITQEQIEALGYIDLVVFGFPCQDLSVAGKRAGLKSDDGNVTRSGLFYDAMRIVRWSKARWALAENVPGLFSSKQGADFAAVVGEMAGAYTPVPKGGGFEGTVMTPTMAVRRLTPRECERLQGFPDDYTLIPTPAPKASKKKLDWEYIKYLFRGGRLSLKECESASADGPRYKALGNSMAVPCMAWIGRRIQEAHLDSA